MVPKEEIKLILLAANNYRLQAKHSNEIGWLRDLTFPSLDDKCKFAGKEFTVEQLLDELEAASSLGQKFAGAVYLRYLGGTQAEGNSRLLAYQRAIYEITHPNQN